MARDKGQRIAVTATAQDVVISDSAKLYTFSNEGTDDIYYRIKDTTNALAGIDAVIVATPIFGAQLKPGEAAWIHGGTWEVACATALTSTLRLIPGQLVTSMLTDDSPDVVLLASIDLGVQPPNLNNDGQSASNTHTTKGTAEEISGTTAFTAGATIEIVGLDTAVYVGADAAAAQTNAVGSPAGVPFRFTLDGTEITFHADAATGGTYIAHQVS